MIAKTGMSPIRRNVRRLAIVRICVEIWDSLIREQRSSNSEISGGHGTHRDDDRADAACDVDLRRCGVCGGRPLASLGEDALFGIANFYLAAVRVAAESEIDAETRGFAKDDRVVGEEQLHLVGDTSREGRRHVRFADHVIVDAGQPE